MEDWKDRAIKEKDELDEKIEKVEKFINSEKMNTLPVFHQLLLYNQLDHMVQYSAILGQRIEYFYD